MHDGRWRALVQRNRGGESIGLKNHKTTVSEKVPLKFRSSLQFLLSRSRLPKSSRPDANELKTSWINEAGLYKLVLKSTMKQAEVFQDWVCVEVLPSIRKTGSYNSTYFFIANPLQQMMKSDN